MTIQVGGFSALHLIACLCMVGCQREPAARVVVAGTTLFTSVDAQRGKASFALCASADCDRKQPLRARSFSARDAAQRTSPLPIRGVSTLDRNGRPVLPVELGKGQQLAILDVPLATPPGRYSLRYGDASSLRDVSSEVEAIEVVAGKTEQFSKISFPSVEGLPLHTGSAEPDTPDRPLLVLELVKRDSSAVRPAAGSLVLRHPPQVAVSEASQRDTIGLSSPVRIAPGPSPNTVSLSFDAPSQRTYALVLLLSPSDPTAAVSGRDFGIVSQALYDRSGLPLSIASAAADPGNGFRIATEL